MRKPRSRYSDNALMIVYYAEKQKVRLYSDPDWARAEASGMETPTGEVHLHRMNHRGKGWWNIVTQRNQICGTVRCRKVFITALGGENEKCELDQQLLFEAMETWANNKVIDDEVAYKIRKDTEDARIKASKARNQTLGS